MQPPPLRFSLIIVAVLGFVLATQVWNRRQPILRVLLPSVAGDAALIVTPEGRTVLIDGGADGAALATWLGNTLPFGQRTIDAIVLTRADNTTLPGQIAALKRYSVGMALLPPTERRTSSLDAWTQLVEAQQVTPQLIEAGDTLQLGACNLAMLHAFSGQAALGLNCGTTTAYFFQSIDDDIAAALDDDALAPATLIVYPWQRPAQTPLLERLQPTAIVFSEGGDSATMLTWNDRQIGAARLYHEAINGQIELTSDERGVRIEVEREE